MKFMLIEDSPAIKTQIQASLSAAFGELGRETVLIMCTDAQTALKKLFEPVIHKDPRPDVILCDWNIEGVLNAPTFYQRVLSDENLNRIPFIPLLNGKSGLQVILTPTVEKGKKVPTLPFTPDLLRSRMARFWVVEDSAFVRVRIARFIRQGFRHLGPDPIVEFENGRACLEALEQTPLRSPRPEVILCDWNMPVMDGLTLLQKIREKEGSFRIPFIMVTSEKEKESVLDAIQAGTSDYICKPFNQQILIEKIASHLPFLTPFPLPATSPADG